MRRKKALINLTLTAALGLLTLACNAGPTAPSTGVKPKSKKSDTTILIGGVEVRVMRPADTLPKAGTLLLLPGWNFSNTKWCDSTAICSQALQRGFVVVAPQMGKSIYATQYFPETRADYKKYPTLTWLDTALDILKSRHKLFLAPGLQRNFVVGLSTGARGAALICAKKQSFFHGAALFSGDYDQTANTEDALCINVYGPYNQFPERWKTIDNPMQQVGSMLTPMYIGHGGMDKVVHVTQSINFYDSLVLYQRNAIIQKHSRFIVQKAKAVNNAKVNEGHLNAPGTGYVLDPADYLELNIIAPAGHDFAYWRSELTSMWAFFDKR